MRIGVDVMGGDFAPDAVVSGAVLALNHLSADERIVLFGNQEIIVNLLQKEALQKRVQLKRNLQSHVKLLRLTKRQHIAVLKRAPKKILKHKLKLV